MDNTRGPGALRSGRGCPSGGGSGFWPRDGCRRGRGGALAVGARRGGNGALPALQRALGGRDNGDRARLPLPRRRGGRDGALPAPRLHLPLGRPLRRRRRLRGPGALRRGGRRPGRPGRSRARTALGQRDSGSRTRIAPRLRPAPRRRNKRNRTRLPLRPALGRRRNGTRARITLRLPRCRGGRDGAFPAPRLHHPLRRRRRLRGLGAPRRGG